MAFGFLLLGFKGHIYPDIYVLLLQYEMWNTYLPACLQVAILAGLESFISFVYTG